MGPAGLILIFVLRGRTVPLWRAGVQTGLRETAGVSWGPAPLLTPMLLLFLGRVLPEDYFCFGLSFVSGDAFLFLFSF